MKPSVRFPNGSALPRLARASFLRLSHARPLVSACALLLLSIAPAHAQLNYATPYTFATFVGGDASNQSGSADGTGMAALFNSPNGVALDPTSGDLFVADTQYHTIRRITPASVATTFAGLAGTRGTTNATGTAARFSGPRGLAVDPVGIIFVADIDNRVIRRIAFAGVATTLVGSGAATVLIDSNDNWSGTAVIATAASKVGAFALDPTSRDAVLIATLPPDSYTAQISGVGNTTGVALAEIYEVP